MNRYFFPSRTFLFFVSTWPWVHVRGSSRRWDSQKQKPELPKTKRGAYIRVLPEKKLQSGCISTKTEQRFRISFFRKCNIFGETYANMFYKYFENVSTLCSDLWWRVAAISQCCGQKKALLIILHLFLFHNIMIDDDVRCTVVKDRIDLITPVTTLSIEKQGGSTKWKADVESATIINALKQFRSKNRLYPTAYN